jgi:hypothetical protein
MTTGRLPSLLVGTTILPDERQNNPRRMVGVKDGARDRRMNPNPGTSTVGAAPAQDDVLYSLSHKVRDLACPGGYQVTRIWTTRSSELPLDEGRDRSWEQL